MHKDFIGTGVALVTPFHKDGSIDFKCLSNIIEHTIDNDVDYLVVLGTTGESATLTRDEKLAIIGFVVETVDNRVPIVLGLGGNNTQEIINCIKSYDFEGISAVLSVTPYYNKPTQKGLYQHYKIIANLSPVPVILYNVPGRTAVNISAETTLRLAYDVQGVIGIKEASGDMEQCMEIIKNKPDDFLVISGDDALTLPLISVGGDGVISVVANAFPKQFSKMVYHARRGNMRRAREIHYSLIDMISYLFAEGNPAGVKSVMETMGLCFNTVRLPLTTVSRGLQNKLDSCLETIEPKTKESKISQ
jgi:4-hydroxy-tetrahydrodipicolinate synthase